MEGFPMGQCSGRDAVDKDTCEVLVNENTCAGDPETCHWMGDTFTNDCPGLIKCIHTYEGKLKDPLNACKEAFLGPHADDAKKNVMSRCEQLILNTYMSGGSDMRSDIEYHDSHKGMEKDCNPGNLCSDATPPTTTSYVHKAGEKSFTSCTETKVHVDRQSVGEELDRMGVLRDEHEIEREPEALQNLIRRTKQTCLNKDRHPYNKCLWQDQAGTEYQETQNNPLIKLDLAHLKHPPYSEGARKYIKAECCYRYKDDDVIPQGCPH